MLDQSGYTWVGICPACLEPVEYRVLVGDQDEVIKVPEDRGTHG